MEVSTINNRLILSETDIEHVKSLTSQIRGGFAEWHRSICDWLHNKPESEPVDYRKLMPLELKLILVNIQRLKPEIWVSSGINLPELLREELEFFLDDKDVIEQVLKDLWDYENDDHGAFSQ